MSRETVALVKEGYAAWNRGDRQWVLDHMAPDFEWVTDPHDPDPGTYRGHEGVERFWARWREAFGQLYLIPEEVIDAGDQVVVVARRRGQGVASGVEIEAEVAQVFTFRGMTAVRCQEFYDREAALQAAGANQEPAG